MDPQERLHRIARLAGRVTCPDDERCAHHLTQPGRADRMQTVYPTLLRRQMATKLCDHGDGWQAWGGVVRRATLRMVRKTRGTVKGA